MTQEILDLNNKLNILKLHSHNYEMLFLEFSNKRKRLPEFCLDSYLELIAEINKVTESIERINSDSNFRI